MTRKIRTVSVLLMALAATPGVQSLSQQCHNNKNLQNKVSSSQLSRRQAMGGAVAAALVAAGFPSASLAASSPPTADELKRIQIGYKQITDLLNNFEEATTTCRENGGECKRDAEPIRE
jgi:secreted PhoX family phosphatase